MMKKRWFFFLRRKREKFEKPVNFFHWIISKVSDLWLDLIWSVYNSIKERINYGLIDARHKVRPRFLKIKYHDHETILLHAAFQVLLDHIEKEVA